MMHFTLELLRRSRAYYNLLIHNGQNCEDIEIFMQHKDHSKVSTVVLVPNSKTIPLTNG